MHSTDGEMSTRVLFSVFDVSKQVFFRSKAGSYGIVNLKPLVPGHVLLIPRRVVARLTDLDPAEISDLFQAVQLVGRGVERAYGAHALSVAVQDGADAGQSVPHVHVHVIPRYRADFGGDKDALYPALETNEAGLRGDLSGKEKGRDEVRVRSGFQAPRDEDRVARTEEEMENEAAWLAGFCTETGDQAL